MKNNGLMIQMMMTALLGSVTTDGVVLCESVHRTCVGDLPLLVKQERSYHFVVRRRSTLFSLFFFCNGDSTIKNDYETAAAIWGRTGI